MTSSWEVNVIEIKAGVSNRKSNESICCIYLVFEIVELQKCGLYSISSISLWLKSSNKSYRLGKVKSMILVAVLQSRKMAESSTFHSTFNDLCSKPDFVSLLCWPSAGSAEHRSAPVYPSCSARVWSAGGPRTDSDSCQHPTGNHGANGSL